MRKILASTFLVCACNSGYPVDLKSELEACSIELGSHTSLPSVEDQFSVLLDESRLLAFDPELHEHLRTVLPFGQHQNILDTLEAAQRSFVNFRVSNPVRGGIVGTASSGFTGAEYSHPELHLYDGLLQLIDVPLRM